MSRDQKFFNMHPSVIVAIVLIALVILAFSMKMPGLTQGAYTSDATERIRPVGQVYRSGEEQEAAAPTVETVPEPEPVATVMSGTQVYNTACIACHGAGVGGAPITGDTAVWSERITQGAATLKEHAVQGYIGSVGYMPPKGGRPDISDAEVEAAVDYMISESE